ncbi:hypothetical protein C3V44_02260 [Capnocytophaga sp. oral taxon 864]|nr:hypothetical protein C3V44_02260 [Capnocytophaga sp. oral taxon 864]
MSKKPREIFLKGCNEIAEVLILHGFKVAQKGQTVSKRPNKEFVGAGEMKMAYLQGLRLR